LASSRELHVKLHRHAFRDIQHFRSPQKKYREYREDEECVDHTDVYKIIVQRLKGDDAFGENNDYHFFILAIIVKIKEVTVRKSTFIGPLHPNGSGKKEVGEGFPLRP